MTLRGMLALVWLVNVACSFKSPGAGSPGADAAGDGAAACMEGQACDDLLACTRFDVCLDGKCQGVATSACTGCAPACDATCGGATCCTQTCPSGDCPDCPSGCSCDLACGQERPCNATCRTGSVCNVYGTNQGGDVDGDYGMTCETGSICNLDCTGDEGSCDVACAVGASCLLDCRNKREELAQCRITCPGPVIACTGAFEGVQVCGRPCPT